MTDRIQITNGKYSDVLRAMLGRRHFSEEELVKLTLAIVAINGWNRLSISFASTPGTYKAGSVKHLRA